ncbi:zwei Ig domain protein zig-5 [Ditylenchus destructor]|nr:zwei Ig domain protein zig-5 [Ditylenchus destructor]
MANMPWLGMSRVADLSCYSLFRLTNVPMLFTFLGCLGLLATAEPLRITTYRVHPKKCPSLADGPSLSFSEDEAPRILLLNHSTIFHCRQAMECRVMSAPPESNVYWYHNEKLVHATTVRDITLNALTSQASVSPSTILGLSQFSHRICVDPFIMPGEINEFKCRIQSTCEPNEIIESPALVAESRENFGAARQAALGGAPPRPIQGIATERAPFITLIQPTRMELAGNFVQLMCNAAGSPKPIITWKVMDNDSDGITHSLDKYPFIWELTNGDLLVDTAQTDLASISLECRATNVYGTTSETTTLIILNEN